MKVHLVDGTCELFRSFYGPPPRKAPDGREVGATIGLLRTLLFLINDQETAKSRLPAQGRRHKNALGIPSARPHER